MQYKYKKLDIYVSMKIFTMQVLELLGKVPKLIGI